MCVASTSTFSTSGLWRSTLACQGTIAVGARPDRRDGYTDRRRFARLAPADGERCAERDHALHGVGPFARGFACEQSAEAPADQAHRLACELGRAHHAPHDARQERIDPAGVDAHAPAAHAIAEQASSRSAAPASTRRWSRSPATPSPAVRIRAAAATAPAGAASRRGSSRKPSPSRSNRGRFWIGCLHRAVSAQPGTRSNAATPGGIWWNACLSTVKIAICGPPNAFGSSSVPTFSDHRAGQAGRARHQVRAALRAELARDRIRQVLAAELLGLRLGVGEARLPASP